MRKSIWTPSIVIGGDNLTGYSAYDIRCNLQAADVPSTIQGFVGTIAAPGKTLRLMTVKLAFAVVSLTIAPAIAQVNSNNRDVSGNLPRDKGASAATIHRGAMVSPAVSPPTRPTVPARARGPGR